MRQKQEKYIKLHQADFLKIIDSGDLIFSGKQIKLWDYKEPLTINTEDKCFRFSKHQIENSEFLIDIIGYKIKMCEMNVNTIIYRIPEMEMWHFELSFDQDKWYMNRIQFDLSLLSRIWLPTSKFDTLKIISSKNKRVLEEALKRYITHYKCYIVSTELFILQVFYDKEKYLYEVQPPI